MSLSSGLESQTDQLEWGNSKSLEEDVNDDNGPERLPSLRV